MVTRVVVDREEGVAGRTWKMEERGHRHIGRPNLKWRDVIRKDTKEKGVQREEAQYRRTWRMKTQRAYPK